MDHLSCHVIYVNRMVGEDRLVRPAALSADGAVDDAGPGRWERDRIKDLVRPLLDAFGDVHVCGSGAACLETLFELQDGSGKNTTPTLILLDTPNDDTTQELALHQPSNTSSSGQSAAAVTPNVARPRSAEIHTPNEDLYGLGLLQKIITEAHLRGVSKLVVPVPVISHPEPDIVASDPALQMTDGAADVARSGAALSDATLAANRRLMRACLDLGAVDVLISPLSAKCITTLEICAYKAHRDAAKEQKALMEVTKGRKRSWVGINESKPFSYLREAMVSGLMNGICRLDGDDGPITSARISVSSHRQAEIAEAVGRWHFNAHLFSDDELLVAALVMFKHALSVPELEHWRIPTDQLIAFLVACRAAYNSFVPYHNFRHVVDVLQATFSFLVNLGALPPYRAGTDSQSTTPTSNGEDSPVAALLTPFEALTLLVTAIGHDVGHPGVNNGFLATLNAPLAQLYNDRSVLEMFHCAAYSQILRRYWPSAFEDRKMRSLMISSILATDMGLHFDYMKKLGDLQEKLQHSNSTDGWNGRQTEDARSLACSLLIKCADISNVARNHDTVVRWSKILSEEFSRQASMEEELGIKSSLLAQPKKDALSLANAQLGFMNMFAIPLFQGVADVIPAMRYTVEQLDANKGVFEQKVRDEKAKQASGDAVQTPGARDGTFSPKTRSFEIQRDVPAKEAAAANGSCSGNMSGPDGGQIPTMTDGTAESGAPEMPQVMADVVTHEKQSVLRASEHSPRNVSDPSWSSDAARELADSDPFNARSRGGSRGDSRPESKTSMSGSRQRCSETTETTEGSASAAYAADWQSQGTTATTGKMAVSPSTQGTSIVSNDSTERRTGPNLAPPSSSSFGSPDTIHRDYGAPFDEGLGGVRHVGSGSTLDRSDGKALKKRPSRFRMKDFPFFRRNKAPSPTPPFSTSDSNN